MYRNWPAWNLLLAATLWGLLWYPLRLFSQAGMNGLWATLVMYLAALVPALFLMRGHWHELMRSPLRLLAIALATGWCNASFIVAVAEKDAARVVLLFYLAPLWSIILGAVFLKERPGKTGLVVCLLALLGALLMLWDPKQGAPWPRGGHDWLALSSGFSFAIANVVIRGLQSVSVPTKGFVTWIGVALVATVWLGGEVTQVPDVATWVWVACILSGMIAIVIMTLSVQYGVTRLPIFMSSIILLFEVFVTIVSSQLLAHEKLGALAWLGGGLIIGASLVFAFVHAQFGSSRSNRSGSKL